MLNSYKELIVWQKSIDLVEEVYILTGNFPKDETYGLAIQERRAAVSIPSNIAEGQRRKDLPEYLQFLRIADASSAELETQIIISKKLYPDLDYSKVDVLLEEVQKMLNVLIRKLEDKLNEKNLKPKTQNLKPNSGQVMLLTVLILGGAILGASTIAGYLMILKIRLSSDITNSTKAAFAADTGIEWGLYKQFKNPNYSKPLFSNNSDFTISNDGQFIKSIGKSSNSYRAFAIQFQEATSTP
ncbi:MAG: four helix bundle protein [Patescibacteria group bacterium]